MAAIDLKNLKFLIVDDHHFMRQMVAKHLKTLKVEKYEHAQSATEAYDKLQNAHIAGIPFDIMCLDWSMPGMTGIELLKKCRADDRFKNTAIIMVTAESELKMVMEAIEAGATSYIAKPFSLDEFSGKLNAVLAWLEKQAAA